MPGAGVGGVGYLPGDGVMIHGGNIYGIAEQLGIPEGAVIDFSASVNPLGVPSAVRTKIKNGIGALVHYPDPAAERLTEEISTHYGLPAGRVLCANGSTELIFLIPRALKPKRVLAVHPTFSEYERASGLSGARVRHFRLRKKNDFEIDPDELVCRLKESDMAFICNPGNPTGKTIEKSAMLEIAESAARHKCVLVVDEAFMDFCPENSVLNADNPYLIVLRSLTKFFALPGLRIGFGVFPKRLISIIEKYREPWSVNSLAQTAGIAALNDGAYRKRTLMFMRKEKGFMEGQFERLGIKYYRSDANYYLLDINEADKIARGLFAKGIVVRECSDFRGLGKRHIRVAVKRRKENTMLIRGLEEYVNP